MRILVIEDELDLLADIKSRLETEGYIVDTSSDGNEGYFFAAEYPIDAAVLDSGLPGMAGIEIIKNLRADGQVLPVLILTARSRWQEKVEGLEAGADDYLVKPFDVNELKARARALLRRSYGRAISEIHYKELVLYPSSHKVTFQEKDVNLTRREYSLLHELVSQPGHVFTRDVLQQLMYGWGDDVESNALEVHIHHLRKKLFPELIRTIRGIGYVVDQEVG